MFSRSRFFFSHHLSPSTSQKRGLSNLLSLVVHVKINHKYICLCGYFSVPFSLSQTFIHDCLLLPSLWCVPYSRFFIPLDTSSLFQVPNCKLQVVYNQRVWSALNAFLRWIIQADYTFIYLYTWTWCLLVFLIYNLIILFLIYII